MDTTSSEWFRLDRDCEGVVRITEWYRTNNMVHVQYTGMYHRAAIRSWADGFTIIDFMNGDVIRVNRVM